MDQNGTDFRRIAVLLVLLILIAGGVFLAGGNQTIKPVSSVKTPEYLTIKLGEITLVAEIVRTEEQLQLGLSGREGLGEDKGMWFDFGTEKRWGIWMKDMKFSIDVVWLDAQYNIITIVDRVAPETYPKTFYPDQDVRYVLELPAGAVEKYHIKVADRVFLP